MSWFKVFSAVVVANIVSWIIISIIGWVIFFVVFDSMTDFMGRKMDEQVSQEFPPITVPTPGPSSRDIQSQWEESQKDRERRRAAAQREAERKLAMVQKNRELCEFWQAEYEKDGTEKSKAYRDMACTRYRNNL
ncbi:hypothetical protein [Marinobacter sp. F3R11]|uniref:hypothetical protein n=1 Tax=Marinobacter sp. F3R11 TaxID=2267231 RepID=UPI000DE95F67|nr:hypothetical protein [Marinobacter sp. F3R11]RBW48899.1 hypothetical protein DS878_12225 [Marinobacter sp. F3R11]